MDFIEQNEIDGVVIERKNSYYDKRGFLVELFRDDLLLKYKLNPKMGYMSQTMPGIARGPHEHLEQTDIFFFPEAQNFLIKLWDNRADGRTYGNKIVLALGRSDSCLVIVPPGVVHGYLNYGSEPAVVLNFPDKLYKGKFYKKSVDEIRHEAEENSKFKMDFPEIKMF